MGSNYFLPICELTNNIVNNGVLNFNVISFIYFFGVFAFLI